MYGVNISFGFAFNFIKPVPTLPVETITCPSSYCCADEPDSINIPAEDIEPLLIALFTKSLPEKFLSLEGASLEALTTFTYSVENPVSPTFLINKISFATNPVTFTTDIVVCDADTGLE